MVRDHPADLPALLPGYATYQTVAATYSAKQLDAAANRVANRFDKNVAWPLVDYSANRVVLYSPGAVSSGQDDTDVFRQQLQTVAAAEGVIVQVAQPKGAIDRAVEAFIQREGASVSPSAVTAAAGTYPTCTAIMCTGGVPMRGDWRLDVTRDGGGRGPCTNGFNVKSIGQNWAYTMTAGHWAVSSGRCVRCFR